MANTLSNYDPIFYAQEALIQLEKALGMAATVHRGYEPEPQQKGSTISITRPSTFVAQDMPASAQDIVAGKVDIKLDFWKGVVFKLNDKELTYTKEKIVNDHIRPAAYAVADAIDLSLTGLYVGVPWYHVAADPAAITDFTRVRKILFDNAVPNDPRYMMVNGEREAEYLELATFHEADKSADGGATQMRGSLGQKFGFSIFANQNVKGHTGGTLNVSSGTLAVSGAHLKGATTVTFAATGVSGTLKKGDSFVIASHSQRYAVAADATAAGNAITVTIADERGLRVALSGSEVVTVLITSLQENLGYHRNAFALAMAPLSEMGNGLGARMATISDPRTSLALRSRVWYDGDNAEVKVGIDALWGVKVLDGDLAVRLRSPNS